MSVSLARPWLPAGSGRRQHIRCTSAIVVATLALFRLPAHASPSPAAADDECALHACASADTRLELLLQEEPYGAEFNFLQMDIAVDDSAVPARGASAAKVESVSSSSHLPQRVADAGKPEVSASTAQRWSLAGLTTPAAAPEAIATLAGLVPKPPASNFPQPWTPFMENDVGGSRLRLALGRRIFFISLVLAGLALLAALHRGLVVARRARPRTWHTGGRLMLERSSDGLRVRVCTWRLGGNLPPELDEIEEKGKAKGNGPISAGFVTEWLGIGNGGASSDDVVVIGVQAATDLTLAMLRRQAEAALGKEFGLGFESIRMDSAEQDGLALLVYARVQLLRDRLNSGKGGEKGRDLVELGFVNVDLTSRQLNMHVAGQSVGGHFLPEALAEFSNADSLKLAVVLGDLSTDSVKTSLGRQPEEEPSAEAVEYANDIRLFGFKEAYCSGSASGRDRIVYKASSGSAIDVLSYGVCDNWIKFDAYGCERSRRPVYQSMMLR